MFEFIEISKTNSKENICIKIASGRKDGNGVSMGTFFTKYGTYFVKWRSSDNNYPFTISNEEIYVFGKPFSSYI